MMRVACSACGHEHNNHHVDNTHLHGSHPSVGDFNPDAHCYNCGSVGKMRLVKAGNSARMGVAKQIIDTEAVPVSPAHQLRIEAANAEARAKQEQMAAYQAQQAELTKAAFFNEQ
jgi:hypothetical protein